MASHVTPYSLGAPGFYGLNTQDSPVDLDQKFALEAINVVIDKWGRIGARKGWVKSHTANSDIGTSDITCIGELVQNDGTRTILATGGGFLFKLVGSTLTTLTYGGGGAAPTINANNWQFCQLNGIGIFFQRGYDPLIYDPVVSATTFRRLSEKAAYAGSVALANTCLSAYGRIWIADTTTDKNTIQFSDIITPQVWTGGTSGTLNLLGVWPMGGDEIVALAAHNNYLIIFGKKQTLLYSGATTPSSMVLADSITSIGCVARDSVQNTGEDVIFLSDSGVRSLSRTIQEKSAPLRGLSKNVHNDIQAYVTADTMDNVKSAYSPIDAFYLVTFPASSATYCFDLRFMLQDGSARTTVWNGNPSKAFLYSKSRKMYLGKPGYVCEYSGYLDDTSQYRIFYYTTWTDFGNPVQITILKKIIATVVGANNQVFSFKWGFDFESSQYLSQATIQSITAVSEYGIAEYGIAEYGGSLSVVPVSVHGGGTGKVLQVGFEVDINDNQVSVQKLEIYTKDGRLGN